MDEDTEDDVVVFVFFRLVVDFLTELGMSVSAADLPSSDILAEGMLYSLVVDENCQHRCDSFGEWAELSCWVSP